MKILGFNISRNKTIANQKPFLQEVDGNHFVVHGGKYYPVDNRGGWHPYLPNVFDHYSGAWQNNDPWTVDSVLAFHAVYACITLIAGDIAKLRLGLVKQDGDGIWKPQSKPAIDKLFKRPNHYQNRIQFVQWWIASKLTWGNTYALKLRKLNSNVIESLFILDPSRVTPLVSPSGMVFYQLHNDDLNMLPGESITVPADEIIHDRMNCLFHPLVGVSPLYASGLAAQHGLDIETDSKSFFKNAANPGGILTAPGNISDETAKRLKEYWQENFTGTNRGKIAALGDGLEFQALRMSSRDAQMIEQLKWNAEIVCSAFKVKPYKIGLGPMPTSDNFDALNQEYYSDCLQILIEDMEAGFDDGLSLSNGIETRMDIDGLFRMDTERKIKTLGEGVSKSVMAPNEARKRVNLPPVPGGDSVYLQQQNFSLEALAQRDQDKPFAKPATPNQPAPSEPDDDDNEIDEDEATEMALALLNSKKMETT